MLSGIRHSMNDTVYIFGAGINKVLKIESPNARSANLSPEFYMEVNPPLVNDFFQVALKLEEYGYLHGDYDMLYDYIVQTWKKSKLELRTSKLNLEDCFTDVEMQLNQAIGNKDIKRIKELGKVKHMFISLFINIFNLFENQFSVRSSGDLSFFGEYIFKNKPAIITFNYDYFIELSIEKASDYYLDNHEIAITPNWKKSQAYGMKFDEIETFGIRNGESIIKGDEFYSTNDLYTWSILKLHGSLNWFQYRPLSDHPDFADEPRYPLPEELSEKIILRFDSSDLTIMGNFDIKGRYVSPIIITPEIHKSTAYERYAYVLDSLWKKAEQILSRCRNLIIIGYSFPESDTRTKELFEKAFSNNNLEGLTIVNPDRSVDEKVVKLCNFSKSVARFEDLNGYLRSLGME